MNFWCFMHGPIVLSIRQDASGLRDRGDGVDWSVEPCISYYLGSRVAHPRTHLHYLWVEGVQGGDMNCSDAPLLVWYTK